MIRVMIVANRAEVREGLCTVLGLAENIQIVAVISSLPAALREARLESPDVVLVDLEMAGDEGCETIRQLKFNCPAIKSIALTAHDYPSARVRAIQAGAVDVLVKGLELPEMVAAIRAAC